MFKRFTTIAAVTVGLSACTNQDATSPLGVNRGDQALFVGPGNAGVVFVSSNATAGNRVMRFERSTDGTLNPAGSIANAVAEHERAAILAALEQAEGSRSRAAEMLGMGRTTLWRKMRQYGIADLAANESST